MSKRVNAEDIVKFHELYAKFGTYAAVARETGFSASTVSRYVKPKGVAKMVGHTWQQLLTAVHEPALKAK